LRSFGLEASISTLNSMIKFATKKITDRSQLDSLKEFANVQLKGERGGESRTIRQVIERAEANIAWMDKNYKKIIEWLEQNTNSG